jgi:hypothetical protein
MKKLFKITFITALSLLLIFSFTGCFAKGNNADTNPKASGEKANSQNGNNPSPEGNNTGKTDTGNPGKGGEQPVEQFKQYNGVKGKILTGSYPSEINKYLENNKSKETQQAFNINNKTYLVMTMGQQRSAGYSIELKDLVLKDGTLKVYIKYKKPGKDDIVATAITHPSLVIETDDIYEGHYEILYDIEK